MHGDESGCTERRVGAPTLDENQSNCIYRREEVADSYKEWNMITIQLVVFTELWG